MRKLMILLATIAFCAGQTTATEIAGVTTSDFLEKWEAAQDGDVLLLESGTYPSGYKLQANKTITIKAAEGAVVVFTRGPGFTGKDGDETTSNNGGIIIEGITIEFNSVFIYLRDEPITIKSLQFINCTIQNSGGANFVKLENSTSVTEEIVIDGCIVKDSNDTGANFMFYITGGAKIENFTVKNSTFYNLDFKGLYTQEKDISGAISVLIENNTIYNWTNLNDYLINFYRGTSDAVFTLKNNIYVADPAISKSIFRTRAGVYTYNNNLTIGYDPYATSGTLGGGSLDLDASALGFSSIADINFADAANGNFTLPEKSLLLTAGVDNGPVGDPRWVQDSGIGVGMDTMQAEDVPSYVNVYSIDGRIVRQNVENAKALEGLNPGIYISNRKKIVIYQ